MASLTLTALEEIPEVRPGDELASLVLAALRRTGVELAAGDVLVEYGTKNRLQKRGPPGRAGRRYTVSPCVELAGITGKDARLLELVLSESTELLRAKKDMIIVEHRLGYVMANAGIDQSKMYQARAPWRYCCRWTDASCEDCAPRCAAPQASTSAW